MLNMAPTKRDDSNESRINQQIERFGEPGQHDALGIPPPTSNTKRAK
jgi:hypothetical protein